VVVLGPAEALNLPAANALLKGLEEPPPNCFFVLVSDQIDRCLPTIVSRCALVRIALPAQAQATQWLQSQGVPAEEAAVRLAEAGGAPVAAMRSSSDALEPEMRSTLLGLLRRGKSLAAADVVNEVPRVIPIAASVVLFQRWVWDYFSFRLGGGLRYHPGEAGAFEALAEVWSLQAAGTWADRLRGLRSVADHPLNPRAAVEGMLLEYIASITVVAQ
jgi:DNA polymerase III subunit delta'